MKKIKREKRGEQERREAQKSAHDVTYENEKKESRQKSETDRRQREEKLKNRWRFADLFAFFALSLSALLFALGPFIRWLLAGNQAGETTLNILNTVAQYCLLAAIALPAWYFVRKRNGLWMILYIVIIVLFILGTVMGAIKFR